MAQLKKTFRFSAPLSPIKAVFLNTAIFLPDRVIRALPKGRVRVKGTFNKAPFALAVQHLKDGSRYFAVSAPLRKAAGIKTGDQVEVSFRLVDPDKIEIPEELQAVLDQDAAASAAWQKFTPGYQRGLVLYVTSVKNIDSRIKRALDLMERAKSGLLYSQKKAAWKGKD